MALVHMCIWIHLLFFSDYPERWQDGAFLWEIMGDSSMKDCIIEYYASFLDILQIGSLCPSSFSFCLPFCSLFSHSHWTRAELSFAFVLGSSSRRRVQFINYTSDVQLKASKMDISKSIFCSYRSWWSTWEWRPFQDGDGAGGYQFSVGHRWSIEKEAGEKNLYTIANR